MDVTLIKEKLDAMYASILHKKSKQKAEILFSIITTKKTFNLKDYKRSIYIDAKDFLHSYIYAVESQDYGYDEIVFDKILKVVRSEDYYKEKNLLNYARRYYIRRGYDTNIFIPEINKVEQYIALDKKQYIKYLFLFVGSNIWGLIVGFLLYILLLTFVLLPAPYEWMAIFSADLKDYSSYSFINCLLNAITIVTGNDDISPKLIPVGIMGIIVYCIGLISFYVLLVNFLYKKLENYISNIL